MASAEMTGATVTPSESEYREQLGAIRWFFHHPARLIEEFPDGIISLDSVCEKSNVPRHILDEEGKAAIAFGVCFDKSFLCLIKLLDGDSQILPGFPKISARFAHTVDGTQQFSASDQDARFDRGPKWHNNSCAVDSVLMVMLMLDMGRCRSDQVSEDLQREISTPLSQTALSIIRKPWSVLSSNEITKLRDLVRVELAALDRTKYKIGTLQDVVSIFDDLTASVPQCQTTWATASRCCPTGDWHYKSHANGHARITRTGLYVPLEIIPSMTEAADFQSSVQMTLDPYPDSSKRSKKLGCTKCKGSALVHEQMKIVIDRPPPTLKFADFNMRGKNGYGKEGMYEDLVLTFRRINRKALVQDVEARYSCWGCIFCVNGNHFVVVVNRAARSGGLDFVSYDGMIHGGRVRPVERSFLDFARRGNYQLSLMLYVQRV